jgi:hypothetical protein
MVFTARTGSSTTAGLEQPNKKTDPMAATLMILFMTIASLQNPRLESPCVRPLN